MSIRIGHASIDENKKTKNGKVGDQTKKEVCIREWYSKPWEVLLVCTDKKMADKAASYMEQICANDSFGYDQNQRLSGYNSIKANNGDISKSKGEFDCSSLVACCYILAGLDISPSLTTSTLERALLNTGKFKAYKSTDRLTKSEYASRGAIYNKAGSHVVMSLDNGCKVDYYDKKSNKGTFVFPTIKKGSKGKFVELWQVVICTDVDGIYGPETERKTIALKKRLGIESDGLVDNEVWIKALNNI